VWHLAFDSSKDQVVFVRPAKCRRVDAKQTEVVKRPRAKLLHGSGNLRMFPSSSAQGEKSDLNQESPKKRSGVEGYEGMSFAEREGNINRRLGRSRFGHPAPLRLAV